MGYTEKKTIKNESAGQFIRELISLQQFGWKIVRIRDFVGTCITIYEADLEQVEM